VQGQVVDYLVLAAVRKAHALEANVALGYDQRLRIGRVDHGVRSGESVDAVLHGADVLEERRHLPHDPVRDAVQPQRHRRCRSHCADTDLALGPEP
jgi:hypothetical protein